METTITDMQTTIADMQITITEITGLLSLVVAILAVGWSIVTTIINYKQNNKLSTLNMQSRYYEKIFDDYLITYIPESREYINYTHDQLTDADKMNETLDQMKKDAKFFKYQNEEFFDELTKAIDALQKDLAYYSNTPEKDRDKQYNNMNEIKTKTSAIYKIIFKYCNDKD